MPLIRHISLLLPMILSLFFLGREVAAETASSAPPLASPMGTTQSITQLKAGITLNDAQDIALRQNRDVLQAALEINRNEARLKSVIAQRYPKITAITFAGQQLNSDYDRNLAVIPGVFQPVTQQYRLGLQVREAEAQVKISREHFRRVKQQAVAEVKKNFLSIIALQSSITSLEENLKFLNELERFVRSEVIRGATLPVDVMLVQARTARADYELEKAKDDMDTMSQSLNRLLAQPTRAPIKLIEESQQLFTAETADAYIDAALKNRPELAEVRLDIRRANLERKVQMSGYIPDVSVGATGIFSKNLDITLPRQLVSVGFLAVWEPWDWGRRMQLAKESNRKMLQDEVKLKDTEEAVAINVDQARRSINVAKKEVVAGALGEISYREELRVMNRRFTAGAALLKDVLEAQSVYVRAIAENVKAKIDIATARIELDEALGTDF